VRTPQTTWLRVEGGSAGYYQGTGGGAAAETATADRGSAAASSVRVAGGRWVRAAVVLLIAALGLMACSGGCALLGHRRVGVLALLVAGEAWKLNTRG
jgi:hypothetical protein